MDLIDLTVWLKNVPTQLVLSLLLRKFLRRALPLNRNVEPITHIVEILKDIVWLIVDYPEDAQVSLIQDGGGLVLKIMVAKSDVGKVIGKQGRTMRALRTLV